MPEGSDSRGSSLKGEETGLIRRMLGVLQRRLLLRRLLLRRAKGRETGREALEEMIATPSGNAVDDYERGLLSNILRLRDMTASDVMVPRADIIAIDEDTPLDSLIEAFTRCNHSRLPIYRGTLDDVIGMVHIKDVVTVQRVGTPFRLSRITRRILFVSPTMRVVDLLLEMRLKRTHMALVVDEYGGIDGLLTIEDVVEQVVGEIEDEHDDDSTPEVVRLPNGEIITDARLALEELESALGVTLLDADDREEVDTVGGLVMGLAGRVPARGELIVHPQGWEFEVTEADPRRIKALKVRPAVASPAEGEAT